MLRLALASLAFTLSATVCGAQACADCAEWNAPHAPVRLFGNTYYVGTNGLSAVLVTSDRGHILIDGALPESAPQIIANIEALGFRVEDVKLILNSHPHFDHAGGIAALQRASGARVAATAPSARELTLGRPTPDDPQAGIILPFPRVEHVEIIHDGDTLRVGPLALVAHLTAGHTPGGTSWSWRSCAANECHDFVYADSQTPVSRDDFYFTRSTEYPTAIQDFERGQATIEKLRCDILVTPHPSASGLWERVARKTLVDSAACVKFVANARQRLAERVAKEQASRP